MTEIVVRGALAASPGLTLTAGLFQPDWVGPALVTLLGLGILAGFVWRVLVTPLEEAVLVSDARTRRGLPPPERYRWRRLGLLGPALPR